ncbi:PAS and ANTAR domain-containing protein [Mycolicibacterium sp. BiH015]|uniref:PAS and ANTAR domain-containing protein n=1 Tax=Mycolicibacterium sp. BiH015 TaxID=3018808 RepID=UPI0022E34227|nr:PAS and ANTAR domain-containing protein [Mycolicibacterium sp. BiH015]MDA2893577.1 PAS and ANTAR domain-containing protein [Mycolicibacterium sp. BiH015]
MIRNVVIEKPPVADGFATVGSFSFLHAEDRWVWSDAVAIMHGYTPGSVEPSTEIILSHKHPDDRSAVAALIDRVRHEGAAFSSRHRIVDVHGKVHMVVVVGDSVVDESGAVLGTSGFYVDITDGFEADVQKSVTRHVASIDEKRSTIQQAVGMIRMAYGVSEDRALDVLKWRSQETNVKLRTIADRLVSQVASAPLVADARTRLDQILLNAHRDGSS